MGDETETNVEMDAGTGKPTGEFDADQFGEHPGSEGPESGGDGEYDWGDEQGPDYKPEEGAEDAAAGSEKPSAGDEKPADGQEAGGDEEVPGEGPPPSLDAGLLVQAGAHGLTAEEVAGFTTNDSLRSAISMAERLGTGQGDQKPDASDEEKPFELELGDVEPEVAEVFGKMQTHYADRVGVLEDQLNQVIQAFQGQQQSSELEAMGEFVSGLGETFKETFGETGFHGTREGTPQHDNWGKLHQAWCQTYNAGLQNGRPVTRGKALEQAAQMLYPDQFQQQQRDDISAKSRRRAASASPRPGTQRRDSGKNPDEEAKNFADQFYADHGGDDAVPNAF